MNTIANIQQKLTALGFGTSVVERYNETQRFYHTQQHLLDVLQELGNIDKMDEALFLAAVFHDAVYDPKEADNEEQSAALFEMEATHANYNAAKREIVKSLILDTKHHKAGSALSQQLIDADLAILNRSFEKLVEY
ncbi:MAG: hypothetical protein IT236_11965 [Bacteroidia bacterium]|nr:hypothetical protein [Bacteroidia bacterium]